MRYSPEDCAILGELHKVFQISQRFLQITDVVDLNHLLPDSINPLLCIFNIEFFPIRVVYRNVPPFHDEILLILGGFLIREIGCIDVNLLHVQIVEEIVPAERGFRHDAPVGLIPSLCSRNVFAPHSSSLREGTRPNALSAMTKAFPMWNLSLGVEMVFEMC